MSKIFREFFHILQISDVLCALLAQFVATPTVKQSSVEWTEMYLTFLACDLLHASQQVNTILSNGFLSNDICLGKSESGFTGVKSNTIILRFGCIRDGVSYSVVS